MTAATGPPPDNEPSTRDALMDAALEQLESRGVLAGLNLSEVADVVGVKPANIYYHFGSRQGLLRAAVARAAGALVGPLGEVEGQSFRDRRLRIYDEVVSLPQLRMTALLALDDDPDYAPLPHRELSQPSMDRLAGSGELPEGFDLDAANVMGLAISIGMSIYADAVARQLDIGRDELLARVRSMYEEMIDAVVPPPND